MANLVSGLEKHARGERLAGGHQVQCVAVDDLLQLLLRKSDEDELRRHADPFDSRRRFELASPEHAARLSAAVEAHTPGCARKIIALLRELPSGEVDGLGGFLDILEERLASRLA